MQADPRAPRVEPLRLACFTRCVANVAYVAAVLIAGNWVLDPAGRPINTDFIAVYTAGRMALDDQPAAAYDWTLHRQMEEAIAGHPIVGYNAWPYPPMFMMIAVAFLLRGASTRAVPPVEWTALGAIVAMLIVLPFVGIPVALPASAVLAARLVRRTRALAPA